MKGTIPELIKWGCNILSKRELKAKKVEDFKDGNLFLHILEILLVEGGEIYIQGHHLTTNNIQQRMDNLRLLKNKLPMRLENKNIEIEWENLSDLHENLISQIFRTIIAWYTTKNLQIKTSFSLDTSNSTVLFPIIFEHLKLLVQKDLNSKAPNSLLSL